MQRSKFPYTARSSAKVIRHAVSIDERRAKFRQDLISQEKPSKSHQYKHRRKHARGLNANGGKRNGSTEHSEDNRGRKPSQPNGRRDTLAVPERYRDRSETSGIRSLSPAFSQSDRTGANSAATSVSNMSLDAIRDRYPDSDDDREQDIQEVWFAGCHAVCSWV